MSEWAKESCGCGATFEASRYLNSALDDALGRWRTEHRHIEPVAATVELTTPGEWVGFDPNHDLVDTVGYEGGGRWSKWPALQPDGTVPPRAFYVVPFELVDDQLPADDPVTNA